MKNHNAFTLVELLVAIVVIALLAAIAAPSVQNFVQVGRRTRCAGSLHAVGMGLRLYLNQSHDLMPVAAAMPSLNLNDAPRICDALAGDKGDSSRPKRDGKGGVTPRDLKQRLEGLSGEERSRILEFKRAFVDRMRQRDAEAVRQEPKEPGSS